MSDFEAMSLKSAEEQLKKLADYHAKIQASKSSIMSVVGDNKFALFNACTSQPGFLDACRKRYCLTPDCPNEEVINYLRKRLTLDTGKQSEGVPDAVASFKSKDKSKVQSATEGKPAGVGSGRRRPEAHCLELRDDHLSGWGHNSRDKDNVLYSWLTPTEYIDYWQRNAGPKKDGGVWCGIYAVRVNRDGVVKEFANSVFGGRYFKEGCIQELAKDDIEVHARPYSAIILFKWLFGVLHSVFGDAVTEHLAALMKDSWNKGAGVSPVYSEFLVSKAYLASMGIDMTKHGPYRFIELPGTFDNNGAPDVVVLNNDNLIRKKDESETGSSDLYYSFNNECFYTELFMHLAAFASSEDFDISHRRMDDMVQFLIRPQQADD